MRDRPATRRPLGCRHARHVPTWQAVNRFNRSLRLMCVLCGYLITSQYMVNPPDYAVKMINRGGDLEDHPRPLPSLVSMTDTIPSWHASQRLLWLPISK